MERFNSVIRLCIFTFLLTILVLVVAATVPAQDSPKPTKSVPIQLQELSVTVRAGNSRGSGALKTTKDGSTWVLTAAHVVEGLRKTREILDNGSRRTVTEFDDPQIVRFVYEGGRKVGEQVWDTEVVRYSGINHGEDLALLRVRSKEFMAPTSFSFYLAPELPPFGADLYHCGSPLGELGSNTLTTGILSQHGRVYQGKVFDQSTCPAMPGSSGGIVALKSDGRYVGMVVRGAGETFNLIVPARRIYDWGKRTGVEFVLNDSIPVPSEEELRKRPVEERGSLSGD